METLVTDNTEIIKTEFIKTSYGKIFLRSIGTNNFPLYLIIHGSGTANGSHVWENFLGEYSLRYQSEFPLYMVAIDCPGYGLSEGSKDTIRGFPEKLISEIIWVLKNEKSAFALMGSSQGGYSIFQAIVQNPNLSKFIIQKMPVCGDIKRLKGMSNPTLLVYDTEDDGHPVKQGRQIIKEIINYEFITFNGKLEPFWLADNLVDCLILFLNKFRKNLEDSMSDKISSLVTLRKLDLNNYKNKENSKSGVKINYASNVSQQKEQKKHKEYKSRVLYAMISETSDRLSKTQIKDININNNQFNVSRTTNRDSKEFDNEVIKVGEVKCRTGYEDKKITESVMINIDDKNRLPSKDLVTEATIEEKLKCPLCYDFLWEPTTLSCQHSFCFLCLEKALIYDSKCPYCRKEVSSIEKVKVLDRQCINLDLSDKVQNSVSVEDIANRKKEIIRETKALNKSIRVEYGNFSEQIESKPFLNKSTNTAKKYKWKLFVRVVSSSIPDPIKSVEFDINVGTEGSKPIIVLNKPFELEKSGNYEFTCNIKINWKNIVNCPSYIIDHKVTLGPKIVSKQFLQNI